MRSIETKLKAFKLRKRYLSCLIPLMLGLGPGPMFSQNLSTTTNALDRINFGDTGTDAYSESAHAFVNLSQPTGTGALGLTYREIAPSATTSDIGIDADNEVLTFTMACSPTLQNYVTIQVWGSDTISDYIYLYTPIQGYVSGNYGGSNEPELDNQGTDPILPGRWVYETLPIPLSMTNGNTSVTLTLDAPLRAGATSRPIYSAFTHTNPYLALSPSDPQGTAPAAAAPTPSTYNSAYFSSIISSISNYVTEASNNQIFGPAWTAAVAAGTVPAQIVGSFEIGLSPSDSFTPAQWLNNDATYTGGNNSGNNTVMQRLEMLAFAYVTPNFLTSFYQNSTTEQQVVAGLDSYSYMQALDGCWGDVKVWDGVGAITATTSNPYGRQNAQCNPIEGQGTWAIGSSILLMQNDSAFLASLNQPINDTLEPGVLRYQAYQTMLVNNIGFLTGRIGHGHAPNQDLLQARSYLYSNLALRVLDGIYGTSLARSNAQMYSDYLNETSGLALAQADDLNVSNGGLGLEVNGSLNGGFDGGYGWLDAYYLTDLAKILNDNGIENATSHPVRDVAINATHAFSNFIYPSLVASGSGYATTMRSEEYLTFRYEGDVGPIDTLSLYYPAVEFNDPYALHGFYLEQANGVAVPMLLSSAWNAMPAFNAGNADNTVAKAMLAYTDYVTLCNMVNSQPTDPTGVTFLNETAHADGVWADPTGSTIAIKHAGEDLRMVLNWRPLSTPGVKVALSPTELMDNVVRVHDTTATMERLATVDMPSSAATGASGNYTSGLAETLYVARYGNYLVGLNYQTSTATLTLPPDMQTSGGTATDLVSGTNYNLSTTTTVSVPGGGAVALYQYLPTSTLSSTSANFGSQTVNTQTTSAVTLSNTGTGPLLIPSVGISGGQASDFSYTTTCGSSLAANASCTITFTFAPTASGTETSTFSLTTSLSTTAQTISLTGTAVGYPTWTVLHSSKRWTAFGTPVTLVARVVSREGPPSGTVTFYEGSTSLGTGTLDGFGVAKLETTALPEGKDSITASYSASSDFAASTSSPITEIVYPECTDHHPGDHHSDGPQWDEGRHRQCWVATNPEVMGGSSPIATDAFFVDGGKDTERAPASWDMLSLL